MSTAGREPCSPIRTTRSSVFRYSRVQLGGRALPRRGRGGWFDSIHAHGFTAAVPRMGRSATNADGEGSSPSGGTTRVAVWDQPGLQNRAGGVRSLGNLPHETCVGSSTDRATGSSPLARIRAEEESLPLPMEGCRFESGPTLHITRNWRPKLKRQSSWQRARSFTPSPIRAGERSLPSHQRVRVRVPPAPVSSYLPPWLRS
jgi:hypothetical protein